MEIVMRLTQEDFKSPDMKAWFAECPYLGLFSALSRKNNVSAAGEVSDEPTTATVGADLSVDPVAAVMAADQLQRVAVRCRSAGTKGYLIAIANHFRQDPSATSFTFEALNALSGTTVGDIQAFHRALGKPQKTEGVKLIARKEWDGHRMVFHLTPAMRNAFVTTIK